MVNILCVAGTVLKQFVRGGVVDGFIAIRLRRDQVAINGVIAEFFGIFPRPVIVYGHVDEVKAAARDHVIVILVVAD